MLTQSDDETENENSSPRQTTREKKPHIDITQLFKICGGKIIHEIQHKPAAGKVEPTLIKWHVINMNQTLHENYFKNSPAISTILEDSDAIVADGSQMSFEDDSQNQQNHYKIFTSNCKTAYDKVTQKISELSEVVNEIKNDLKSNAKQTYMQSMLQYDPDNTLGWKLETVQHKHFALFCFLACIPGLILFNYFHAMINVSKSLNTNFNITLPVFLNFVGAFLYIGRFHEPMVIHHFRHDRFRHHHYPYVGRYLKYHQFKACIKHLKFFEANDDSVQSPSAKNVQVSSRVIDKYTTLWAHHYQKLLNEVNSVTVDETSCKWEGRGEYAAEGNPYQHNNPSKPTPCGAEFKTLCENDYHFLLSLEQHRKSDKFNEYSRCNLSPI